MSTTMDWTQDSFKPISKQEERILEMYSRGEAYEVIQENLLLEYGKNYNGKKLGQKMGEIKKKMRCETQFQMGYLYGRRENHQDLLACQAANEMKLLEARTEGYNACEENHKAMAPERGYHKGLNVGLVAASIFWLIIIGLLNQYIL